MKSYQQASALPDATIEERAHDMASRLVECEDSYRQGRLVREGYHARLRALWLEIETTGLRDAVLAILRDAACGPAL